MARLTLAIVEFELARAPHLLPTMDYTYRERHGEAIYRFRDGMLTSDFFRRNVVLAKLSPLMKRKVTKFRDRHTSPMSRFVIGISGRRLG